MDGGTGGLTEGWRVDGQTNGWKDTEELTEDLL